MGTTLAIAYLTFGLIYIDFKHGLKYNDRKILKQGTTRGAIITLTVKYVVYYFRLLVVWPLHVIEDLLTALQERLDYNE